MRKQFQSKMVSTRVSCLFENNLINRQLLCLEESHENFMFTAEQDPLAAKVAEFLSCWESVPSDKKDSLPAKRRVDFEMHAKIVGKLHSQAPSSYSSLDATAAHNLAMNSDYLLGKCMNIDAEMVNHSEEVEKGKKIFSNYGPDEMREFP